MKNVLFLGTECEIQNLSALWIDQTAKKEIKNAYVFNGGWYLTIDKDNILAGEMHHPRPQKIYVINIDCESNDYNIVIEKAREILKFNIANNIDCEYKF